MKHQRVVELKGRIELPASVSIRDIVSFLGTAGASAGLGDVEFFTLNVETRDFVKRGDYGDAYLKTRRLGCPTLDDLDTIGADPFTQGFAISGRSARIAVQTSASRAIAEQTWSPDKDEPEPQGWVMTWYDQFLVDIVTDKSHPTDEYETRCAATSKLGIAFAKSVLEHLPTTNVLFERPASFAELPEVPLVRYHTVLYSAPKDVILECYTSVDGFAAGWDDHYVAANGCDVFVNGETLIKETDLWMSTIDRQFVLAQAAKPGLAQYKVWKQPKAHAEYLQTMPQRLEQLGYSDAAKSIEFTAYLSEDQTLTLRDLYHLATLRQKGLPTGEPLEKIIVTFANKDMAQRVSGPLHGMGVVVHYHAADGCFAVLDPED